jgi:hypothetical protein
MHWGAAPVVVATLAIAWGSAPVSPRQITKSGAGAHEVALATMAGGAMVAWYGTRDGNGEIYVRQIDSRGKPDGPEIRLTTDPQESYEPSIDAVAADAVAVAWHDKPPHETLTARLGVWDRAGRMRWATRLPSCTRNPVVRTDGRMIVVAWIQREAEGTEAVWLARWDAHGASSGPPQRLGPAHRTTWNLNAALDDRGVAWVVFDAMAGTRASELFLARVESRDVALTRLTSDDGHESKYPDIAVHGGRAADLVRLA